MNQFVLHVGTNDLDSYKSIEFTAKIIVKHALLLKNDVRDCDVTISKYITQANKLKVKGEEVDPHMKRAL